MNQEEEMERKYLIIGDKGNYTDFQKAKASFREMVEQIKLKDSIDGYFIEGWVHKTRPYRYFDTFEGRLAENRISTFIGPLEESGVTLSVRARENDCVLTVKFPVPTPDKRDEYQFPFPPDTDFYKLNPEDFRAWEPLQRARHLGRNMPLQEAVRLEVHTHRFDLSKDNMPKVQVALDEVVATGAFNIQKTFYELEIERREGMEDDVFKVSSFFTRQYEGKLRKSSLPKWIKALRLIRGEEIQEEPED